MGGARGRGGPVGAVAAPPSRAGTAKPGSASLVLGDDCVLLALKRRSVPGPSASPQASEAKRAFPSAFDQSLPQTAGKGR